MRILPLIVLLLGSFVHADPSGNLDSIASRLARPAVVRGEFEQSKQIAGLSRPLVSRGRFVVGRGVGVLWDTVEPFPHQLRITRGGLHEQQADGGSTFVEGEAPSRALAEVSRVLAALFEADLAVLEEHFTVTDEATTAGWRITLAPRAAALASVFAGIELQGDELVREIILRETNGDRTGIRFAGVATDTALSEGERRALEQ